MRFSNKVSTVVSLICGLLLFGTLAVTLVFLPHFSDLLVAFFDAVDRPIGGSAVTLLRIFLAGLIAVAFVAVALLSLVLRKVLKGGIFTPGALGLLRILSYLCFLEGALILGMGFFLPFFSLACFVLGFFAMVFIGLLLRVVRNVIAEGMRFKEENDLTV